MKRSLSFFSVVLVLFHLPALLHQARAQAPKEITNSIGTKLVLVPKGTFVMELLESDNDGYKGESQHKVTISNDYYLGVYEVTQSEYQQVMTTNPSYFQGEKIKGDSSRRPVERVAWRDAVEFCKRLSELPEEKKAGRIYRLPTEAEWEYACSCGSNAAYSFGDSPNSLGDFAWFYENSNEQTHPVGQKKPNAWGLYDMPGNVWEWCSDRHGEYPKGAVTDPVGPSQGLYRVLRGGSYRGDASDCLSANRSWHFPAFPSNNTFGFRVALSSQSGIPKSPEADK
jgi:formylglycine-generating enzyme required for sulfatase activity